MSSKRGRAYRRWKTFTKYVTRLKKRLSWMQIQYGEYETEFNGLKYTKYLWRNPKNWEEADENNTASAKSLKDTPTPYSEYWEKYENHHNVKKMREESKRIIDNELNSEENDNL